MKVYVVRYLDCNDGPYSLRIFKSLNKAKEEAKKEITKHPEDRVIVLENIKDFKLEHLSKYGFIYVWEEMKQENKDDRYDDFYDSCIGVYYQAKYSKEKLIDPGYTYIEIFEKEIE